MATLNFQTNVGNFSSIVVAVELSTCPAIKICYKQDREWFLWQNVRPFIFDYRNYV